MATLSRGLVGGALQSALATVAALVGTAGRTPSAALVAVAATTVLVVVLEASAQRGDDRAATSRDDRWLAGATSAAMALATLGGLVELGARGGSGDWLLVGSGCALAIAGASLRARAIGALGERFITEARAPAALVTGDVFALVRHPSELGLLIIVVGLAIAAPGVATGVALLGSLVCTVARTRREDRALAAAFGEAHAIYARRVGSLLPRVLPRASA